MIYTDTRAFWRQGILANFGSNNNALCGRKNLHRHFTPTLLPLKAFTEWLILLPQTLQYFFVFFFLGEIKS